MSAHPKIDFNNLTEDDVDHIAEILIGIRPLFHAIKVPRKIFEANCGNHKRVGTDYCVFNKEGKLWLTGRPSDPLDPFSGLWHIPGAMHMPGERKDVVLKRLLAKEFQGAVLEKEQEMPYLDDFPVDQRGSTYVTFQMIALCTGVMPDTTWGDRGAFFEADNLPRNIIEVQRVQAVKVHKYAKEIGLF